MADARDQRTREFRGVGLAAQVPGAHIIGVQGLLDRGSQPSRHVRQVAVIEHHRGGEQQRDGIGDAFAGNVGRGAVHRFEYGGVGADIAARRHPQAAHQAGDQIREDVAEQIRGHEHVELPGIEHELHGAGIDDDGFQDEFALVFALVQLEAGFEKNSGQGLHDVGFVDDGDFLAAGGNGVLERELQQAAAALARIDAGGHGHCMRIVVDRDVDLMADIQALEILAHHHQVDVVESAAGNQRAGRTQIRIELELFPQTHIGGSIAAARGGFERTFEGEPSTPDTVQGLGRKGITRCFDALQARDLPFPLKWRTQRRQYTENGVHDFGADPVSGDQRGRNGLRHRNALMEKGA